MSTLAQTGAGSSFAHNATAVQRGEHLPLLASFIPRSALQDSREAILEDGIARANSLLEREGHEYLDVDITLDARSSQSMDVIHDVSLDDQSIARTSTQQGFSPDAATVRMPSSPRKPIPSQWLPLRSGPNLTTAQRAKERGHKKGSINGSPIEAKALRGMRSLADIAGTHGAEGASFPTKTAHAAVDSDLTSAKSPVKGQRASSKPAWNSPTSSPRRESPQQQPHLIIVTSPIKKTFLSADAKSYGHRRGTSVDTSAGDTVYHSAQSSPVRSTASSPESTVAVFDENHIPDLQLSADSGDEQAIKRSSLFQMTTKAATVANSRTQAADEALAPHASPTSSHWGPPSGSSVSRIPRVAKTNAASAHSPTRSSTLKGTQSANLLTSPKARLQSQAQNPHMLQPSTPSTASIRHVRTVNSSGAAPILSLHSVPDHVVTETEIDSISAHNIQTARDHGASKPGTGNLGVVERSADISKGEEHGSQGTRISTVKSTSEGDPGWVDPAMIYSKKAGASGMALESLTISPIKGSMAHDYDTGISSHNNGRGDVATAASSRGHSTIHTPMPARGRSEQPGPNTRRQDESEHSLQSSVSSDLRATATEFVPHPHSKNEDNIEASSLTQNDPTTDLLGPMKYELDMYGIPWYYYMYQVQFAYDQGFQKGRSKPSKKTRQKKHRSPISSPMDTLQQPHTNGAVANFVPRQDQHAISEMPPPASTLPLAEQRAQSQRTASVEAVRSTSWQQNDQSSPADRPFSPFAAQRDLIDRQVASRNYTVTDRLPTGIDLTMIRNVGLPQTDYPITTPYHNQLYNYPRRHNRGDNGLYSYRGRGAAGVRMQDTVPFPNPVPPQGRPTNAVVGSEACGTIDVVYAAERIGGDACHDCEPDHPLE